MIGLFLIFLLAIPNTDPQARPSRSLQKERQDCLNARYQADTQIAICSRAIQAFPRDGQLWGKRGSLWLSLKNFAAAEKDLNQSLRLGHKTAKVYVDRAYSLYEQSRFEPALADCERAIAISSDDVRTYAHLMRGRIWHQQGKWTKALHEYNRALALRASPIAIFTERGVIWYELKQYEKAMADFNWVLEVEPNHPVVLHNRALVWMQLKDYRQAEIDCSRSLSLDPSYADGYYTRAFLFSKTYQHAQVVSDLTQHLKMKPRSADAYDLRAWAHALLGNYADAHADIEQLIQIAPFSALSARFTQAWIFYLEGQLEQTRKLLEHVSPQIPASESSAWLQNYLPELLNGRGSEQERESFKALLIEAQKQQSHAPLNVFYQQLLALKAREKP